MKYISILGILAILVAVFAYYTLFSGPNRSMPQQADQSEIVIEQEQTTNKWEPRSGVASLKELMNLGNNIECSISQKADGTEGENESFEGTYFVSNSSIRGDFLTQSPDLNGQILSSMIIDGSHMYMWSNIDGQSYGMKMSLSELNQHEEDDNNSISLSDEVEYNCKQWENVDNTIFLPPADVLFSDFGEHMKTGMEYGTIYAE